MKIIAMISMVLDHAGDLFFPEVIWMRALGRIAMPLFAFCVAEGFAHTRNKWRYLFRMGLFAIASEFTFDLAFYGKLTWEHQNIMCTFFIAILALICLEKIQKEGKPITYVGAGIVAVLWCALALILKTDYNYFGVLMVYVFYVLRDKSQLCRNVTGLIVQLLLRNVGIYIYGALSFIPLMLYNGKKGVGLKWFFYVFYPGHLLVLFLVKMFL